MTFSNQRDFNTAEELIHFFLTDPFFRTNRIWEVNTIGRGYHIYRGQADANWSLIPKVFRSNDALKNFTPQYPGKFSPNQKERWLGYHLHAELRSIFIFLETADKLGIKTPLDYTRLTDHRKLISSALEENGPDFTSIFPNEKMLEELALAQHHGIPTRILDWSESPLIACFFAALEASSTVSEANRISSDKIAVICLKTSSLTKSDNLIAVRTPKHANDFLRLQQGVFTHMPMANKYFMENDEWPSIEDIIENTKELKGALKKYCIPTGEADNMLKILFDYGITPHQLMPSLDNVAKSYMYASTLFNK